MQIVAAPEQLQEVEAQAVVVGVDRELSNPAAEQLDRLTQGTLRRLLERQEWKPSLASTLVLHGVSGMWGPVVLVGLEDQELSEPAKAFRAAAAGAKAAAARPRQTVAFYFPPHWDHETRVQAIIGAAVGCQGQDLFCRQKRLHPWQTAAWSPWEPDWEQALIVADAVNLARRLVNLPPDDLYPESMAQIAKQQADQANLQIEVLDEKQLEAEGAGAMLAVGRGSDRPPRLVILRWQGTDPQQPPVALVGKGVTVDSGGPSLKSSESMKTMKCDMAGAASVLATLVAVARLRLPVNVLGLLGLVENLPSGRSMKLGDVLRARNGTTIEVLNTDAEGRLVLADVLSKAVDLGASALVDLATLTGSCMVALGTEVAGLMTNHQELADQIMRAAQVCGEPLWQLPMFKHYGEMLKSEVADVKNVSESRWAGTITAAKFLEHFVSGRPWVHLDIAGPAFLDKPKPWLDAGGTGCMVRTLVHWLHARSAPT